MGFAMNILGGLNFLHSQCFKDSRIIPFAIACILFVFLIVLVFTSSFKYCWHQSVRIVDNNPERYAPHSELEATFLRWANFHGGFAIFGFMLARLFGCFVLACLSIRSMPVCKITTELNAMCSDDCAEVFMVITFTCCFILAVVSLTGTKWRHLATRCNAFILISSLGVYAYRDLWPLATYSEHPMDDIEGNIFWAKITVLTVTAVGIPLFIPRRYLLVDPKGSIRTPNPEQTASLISMLTYTFLDATVLLAYRMPHLRHDQLSPLADYDCCEYLTRKASNHLRTPHGARRRHLFFGLISAFRKDFLVLITCIVGQAFFTFASPVGINRLLNYLETGGANSSVRPWFWIFWLFLGPMFQSLCFHYYNFLSKRTFVRLEAVLIQLVFEHSLCIRLKVETSNDTRLETIPIADRESASGTRSDSSSSADTKILSENAVEHGSSISSTSDKNSAKGKEKAQVEIPKTVGLQVKDSNDLTGKINNLVTTDMANIDRAKDFLVIGLLIPLQFALCTLFLYQVLGWSAFVGLAITIILIPVPGYVARNIQQIHIQKMKMTDARIQAITEAVNVIRMIKLAGWESLMYERLQAKRDDELRWLRRSTILAISNSIISFFIPALTMFFTYATYTLIMKEELNASKTFSSVAVFLMMQHQLHRSLTEITSIIQGKVSLDRVDDFLHETDLLDSFQLPPDEDVVAANEENSLIGFRNASFSWSVGEGGSVTPSSRSFKLRINGELLFKRNSINLVIGPTGSGKTSLLMALLGEMHFIPSGPDSWFNLPRDGGVAYAAQESWVQNDTIRNNILFNSPFDERRYRKVIRQCALEHDLQLFEAGDGAEVGERGITLSGGQKARLTLARAIYSSASVILLDDVFAALDVHTSTWLIDQCFRGDLVIGRTVILVSHNAALAGSVADRVVFVGGDGVVQTRKIGVGPALPSGPAVTPAAIEEKGAQLPNKTSDGKLVDAEEIPHGHVTWRSMRLLFIALGGDHPILFFLGWTTGLVLAEWAITLQTWFLGFWGSQYENHTRSDVNALLYLSGYALILFAGIALYSGASIIYIFGSLRAARMINSTLLTSIFGTTFRWLDKTPTARIIARCTQDIQAVDERVPRYIFVISEAAVGVATKIGAVALFAPIFLVPGLVITVTGIYLGNMYLKAQLSVKREMSNARSPMLGNFIAAIHGLVSIRAYSAQKIFKEESMKHINHYTRAARTVDNLNCWVGVRMDILGALFTATLAFYLVYGRPISAANIGFTLNMAVEVCSGILGIVTMYSGFEVSTNSLERIQGYIDIEQEPSSTESGKPPAAWPTSGDLRVENLSARHHQSGPNILHDISFHISSGQRIGVVGRTGSGKSSLVLALLRCICTEGTVYLDGLPTSNVNLDALRSNVTVIPQTPELLSGTLRQNLDPFEQNDDATLNDALRASGLFSLQEAEDAQITLDTKVAEGGSNFSVGQRQIIALARAMVRRCKLLILDEATSAIDYSTDSLIQSTIRTQIEPDVTVITVAHRLQTIMDADKIMLLDDGHIVEFDSPRNLLEKDAGIFRALVDGSADRFALHALGEHPNARQVAAAGC